MEQAIDLAPILTTSPSATVRISPWAQHRADWRSASPFPHCWRAFPRCHWASPATSCVSGARLWREDYWAYRCTGEVQATTRWTRLRAGQCQWGAI